MNMTESDRFEDRLAEFDVYEIMKRIVLLARIADRIDPDIAAERVPLLMAEAKSRGYLTDPQYIDDEDFAFWLPAISDAARRSSHPAVIAILDDIKTRKPRAVRHDCALCFRPRVREGDTWCVTCYGFLTMAFGGFASLDEVVGQISTPLVRAHAPICYLCGIDLTNHAEHVIPLARGGEDRLSNLGGACWKCNVSKGARIIESTDEQMERLSEQQVSLRRALDAIDRDAFWLDYMFRFWGDWIDGAVEDIIEWDDDEVERSDVMPYIEDASDDDMEEMPFMPHYLKERAVDEVLRRLS
jgi:5-methylcytosine-specific restriction endonuclease McrA